MPLSSISTTLRTRFLDQWLDPVVTVFDNAEAVEIDGAEPFVRFAIRFADERRLSTGANALHSVIGRVWLQVFVPNQEGTAMALDLADAFAAIFRNWRSLDGSVTCSSPSIDTVPSNDGWHQVNVSIPFEAIFRL